MVTIKLKDELLSLLCEQDVECMNDYCISELCDKLHTNNRSLLVALESLQGDGFIFDLNFRPTSDIVYCIVCCTALEFIENGGYSSRQADAELRKCKLRLEVELLTAELENLKKVNPTLAERVIAVLADLSAFAGLFT